MLNVTQAIVLHHIVKLKANPENLFHPWILWPEPLDMVVFAGQLRPYAGTPAAFWLVLELFGLAALHFPETAALTAHHFAAAQ